MSRVRFGSAMVVGSALMLGALGCGDSSKADKAAASGTLVIALPAQPDNLNPIYGDNIYEGNQKAFNGLLRYDHDLNAEPDLAASMPTRSTDGKTVTVKLRDDVTFSDGMPFTAKDVVFTYQAIIDPKSASPLATLLDSLLKARAVDDTTVEFDLNRADPAFYDKLQVGILPEHLLAGKELKNAAFNRKPVGTGPYIVTEFQPGGRIVEEANPSYFRGPAKIKRLVLTAVEDENARVALLEKGTIDAAGVLPKLAPRGRRNKSYNVFEVRTADARVAALPNRDPVLKDPAGAAGPVLWRRPPEDRRRCAGRRRRARVRPAAEGAPRLQPGAGAAVRSRQGAEHARRRRLDAPRRRDAHEERQEVLLPADVPGWRRGAQGHRAGVLVADGRHRRRRPPAGPELRRHPDTPGQGRDRVRLRRPLRP
jgi:hypothetical protein